MDDTMTDVLREHIDQIIRILDEEDTRLGDDFSIVKELAHQMRDELEAATE